MIGPCGVETGLPGSPLVRTWGTHQPHRQAITGTGLSVTGQRRAYLVSGPDPPRRSGRPDRIRGRLPGSTLCTRSVRQGWRRTDLVHKVADRTAGWCRLDGVGPGRSHGNERTVQTQRTQSKPSRVVLEIRADEGFLGGEEG